MPIATANNKKSGTGLTVTTITADRPTRSFPVSAAGVIKPG